MKGWSSLHKEQSNVWLSVQRNEWQRVGTERGCAGGGKQWCVGVISTKSVPYDTHSHGLCLDSLSLSLSVKLSPHLLLSLSLVTDEGTEEEVGEASEGRRWIFLSHNRSSVMTGARPCHTPGSLLITRRELH